MTPFKLSFVSIIVLNLLISFTIAIFQLIDFSNLNFLSIFLNQSLEYFKFLIGPRHPFLLSYEINPLLKDSVAIFCNFKFIGVLML